MAGLINFIHSILGQSRIGVFLLRLMGAFYLILASLMILVTYFEARDYAVREAEAKADRVLARNLAIHTYINQIIKPNVFNVTDAYLPAGYFDPTWMSSTYAVREIDKLLINGSDFNGYYYKEAAVNARSPLNEADPTERAFLEQLNRGSSVTRHSQLRVINGAPYMEVLLRGESISEDCLRCHSTPDRAPSQMVAIYGDQRSFGRSAGEVVSVISIRVPLMLANYQAGRITLQIAGIIVVLLAGMFLAQRMLIEQLVLRPLDQLRIKALEIAEVDGRHLGELITLPYGRELNDLASAFNKLSISLRERKDLLEDRIRERNRQLEVNQHLIQHILDLTPSPLCLFDVDIKRFIYANHKVLSIFGVSMETFLRLDGTFTRNIFHPDDIPAFTAMRAKIDAGSNDVHDLKIRFNDNTGGWRWLALRTRAVDWDANGKPRLLLFMGDDITEAHYAEARMRHTSTHDALTGLHNWAYFEETIEVLRSQSSSMFPVGLIMMDVDNLKQINDHIGHVQGDELLRKIGGVLLGVFRDNDIIARIGGDEFVALMPQVDEAEARIIAKRVQVRLKEATKVGGVRLDVVSMGISAAAGPDDLASARMLADKAMYLDKQIRKGCGQAD